MLATQIAEKYDISVISAFSIVENLGQPHIQKSMTTYDDCIVVIENGMLTDIMKISNNVAYDVEKERYFYTLNLMSPSTWNNNQGEDITSSKSYDEIYYAAYDYSDIMKKFKSKWEMGECSLRIQKKSAEDYEIISEEEFFIDIYDMSSESDDGY